MADEFNEARKRRLPRLDGANPPTPRAAIEGAEIAIPCGRADDAYPVAALRAWLELSEISAGPLVRWSAGPLVRKVNRGDVVETAMLSTDTVRPILVKRAGKAGLNGTLAEPFSPHGLRAGFVTKAYRNGVPDEKIMESRAASEPDDDA